MSNNVYNDLPDFLNIKDIESAAATIKDDLSGPINDGVDFFAKFNNVDVCIDTDYRKVWSLAAKLSLFNAVYFVSREEAAELSNFGARYADEIDEVGDIIDNNGGIAQIANFALHKYVQDFGDTKGRSVMIVNKSTPKHAIQGYNQNMLAVKKSHFIEESSEECLVDEERHDWHDLAHVLAASASGGAFGVKYHNGLDQLPRYYRQLTEGSGASDASGPKFSDGLIFSHLSLPLFDTNSGQVGNMAQEIYQYLRGEKALEHPGIKERVIPERPINELELATCLQNKRYERRAAEMEKFLLVRGTPQGERGEPHSDPLLKMARSERLSAIANLEEPLYFERRNLFRHRAHEQALGMVAIDMQKTNPNSDLANKMLNFYLLTDLENKSEINLYEEVKRQLN